MQIQKNGYIILLAGLTVKKSQIHQHRQKNLDYDNISKDMRKGLRTCRQKSRSLDLFCLDLENKCNI